MREQIRQEHNILQFRFISFHRAAVVVVVVFSSFILFVSISPEKKIHRFIFTRTTTESRETELTKNEESTPVELKSDGFLNHNFVLCSSSCMCVCVSLCSLSSLSSSIVSSLIEEQKEEADAE